MFSEIWYCNSLWTHDLHDSHRGNGLKMVNGVLITQKSHSSRSCIEMVYGLWTNNLQESYRRNGIEMVYGLIISKKVFCNNKILVV